LKEERKAKIRIEHMPKSRCFGLVKDHEFFGVDVGEDVIQTIAITERDVVTDVDGKTSYQQQLTTVSDESSD
jgi:hypothetical protein